MNVRTNNRGGGGVPYSHLATPVIAMLTVFGAGLILGWYAYSQIVHITRGFSERIR